MDTSRAKLRWKSSGTGYYGFSGSIPVAVVRPLSGSVEGHWTWTLLVGPPVVLQKFESAGERKTLAAAQRKAEACWRCWRVMADLLPKTK